MIRKQAVILLLLLALSTKVFPESAKIAVMDFEPKNVAPATAAQFCEVFRGELFSSGKYSLIPKADLDKAYKDNASLKTVCTSNECAVETGKVLNVSRVIIGTFKRSMKDYQISVKLVDVTTGSTLFTDAALCDRESKFGDVSKAIIGHITEQAQAAVPVAAPALAAAPVVVTAPSAVTAAVPEKAETKPQPAPARTYTSSYGSETLSEKEDASQKNLLKGKIGFGLNWTGAQVRMDMGSNILAELRGQYNANNLLLAARGYFIMPKIPGKPPIQPYWGLEFGMPFSTVLTSGFEAGAFAGGEVLVTKNIGIGLDAGPYFISIASELGSVSDFGVVINLGVTYYF